MRMLLGDRKSSGLGGSLEPRVEVSSAHRLGFALPLSRKEKVFRLERGVLHIRLELTDNCLGNLDVLSFAALGGFDVNTFVLQVEITNTQRQQLRYANRLPHRLSEKLVNESDTIIDETINSNGGRNEQI